MKIPERFLSMFQITTGALITASSIHQLWGVLSPLNFQCFLILLRARASSLYDLATPSNVSPRDQSQVIRLDSSLISIP